MFERGVAASIEPKTIIEMGKVAKQMFEASDCPAKPPIVKMSGICAPKNACAMTKTVTFRRARLCEAGSVFVAVIGFR